MPGSENAPKLWPALPVIASCTEPSVTPRSPKRAAIAPAMPAPPARRPPKRAPTPPPVPPPNARRGLGIGPVAGSGHFEDRRGKTSDDGPVRGPRYRDRRAAVGRGGRGAPAGVSSVSRSIDGTT